MKWRGRSAVVTGAGSGIGAALARAIKGQGARVMVADRDAGAAEAVAREIGGTAFAGDLRRDDAVRAMIAAAETAHGPVEILVSNAGFAAGALDGPASAPDAQWQDSWDLHVMAHLRAARLVLPGMVARGEGWLVSVASAAGLLSQIGDAPYSATKHAAVSLSQSLAVEHGAQGIHVSVVCPLYVATPLLGYAPGDARADGVIGPDEVARATLDGIAAGRFLILPHPEAADHLRRRADDMDRWVRGMARLRDRVWADGAPASLAELHTRM